MDKLLLIVIIVLGIIAVAQLARVYELAAAIRNKREEDISLADNKLNANLWLLFMFLFYGFVIWLCWDYKDKMLPISASEHGVKIDALLDFNWIICFAVFFLVNTLLFGFSWKYYYREGTKAYYYPHNSKWEMIWTIVPTIVLAVIIIYGLNTWNGITAPASKEAINIELYGKQFNWVARYPGEDNKMGYANYTMISESNALGLVSPEKLEEKLKEIDLEMIVIAKKIANEVIPDDKREEMEEKIARLKRTKAKILNLKDKSAENDYKTAEDDKIVKGEFHIPIGKEINFLIRSQDVIHSAFMPHFRAQMNAVPGMTTQFKFTPTITTEEMRVNLNDEKFNYILLCNKVCGSAHYNMQMNIVVESEKDYKKWLANQKPFKKEIIPTAVTTDSTKVAEIRLK
jgi:cytochrome c oxidase subunit II